MSLEELVRDAMEKGAFVSLHAALEPDQFSASVYVPERDLWATKKDCDPVAALRGAAVEFERLERDKARVTAPDPAQLDLLAPAPADEFEGLL